MKSKITRSFLILFLSSFLLGSGILYYFLYHTFLNQETSTLFEKIAIIETSDLNDNEELGTILNPIQASIEVPLFHQIPE